MLNWITENKRAFLGAVMLHIVLFSALFMSWQSNKVEKIVAEQGEIIQVSSVDANSYQAEIDKIAEKKRAQKRKIAQQQARKKAQQEKKKQLEIQKKKDKKRQAEALKRKQAAELKAKKAAEANKRALAKKKAEAAKAKKIAEAKKLKAKKLAAQKAELKKKAELKRKAEQEKQRIKEAKQKKAQQEAQRKQRQAEQKRQAELKRQQERDEEAFKRRSKGVINRHVAMIVQKIERNWRQPLNAPSGLQCTIHITVLPNGRVLSAKVIKSSGNLLFDRSVEIAVSKAEPLPVPSERAIFEEFKEMNLRFEPGSN